MKILSTVFQSISRSPVVIVVIQWFFAVRNKHKTKLRHIHCCMPFIARFLINGRSISIIKIDTVYTTPPFLCFHFFLKETALQNAHRPITPHHPARFC